MPRYLDEFSYRLRQRWDERALFPSILGRALVCPPFPSALLVAASGGLAKPRYAAGLEARGILCAHVADVVVSDRTAPVMLVTSNNRPV